MLYILNYVVVLLALIYSTITDIKNREVSNFITLGLIAYGLISNAIISFIISDFYIFLWSLVIGSISFLVFYLFWKIGVFAGGDAKLFAGISFTIPLVKFSVFLEPNGFVFIIYLFLLTYLVMAPYALSIGLYYSIKKKLISKIYSTIKLGIFYSLLSAIIIGGLYSFANTFNINLVYIYIGLFIIIFLNNYIKIALALVLLVTSIIYSPFVFLRVFISVITISLVLSAIIVFIKMVLSGLLNKRVKLKNLKEGDILANSYYLNDSKLVRVPKLVSRIFKAIKKRDLIELKKINIERSYIKRNIVIDNRYAGGLRDSDIKVLEEYFSKGEEFEIKKSLPLVPAILIAYIILVLFGDFL